MKGLPRSYIKKYGVTKKAWREYRKRSKRRISTARTYSRRRKYKSPKRVRGVRKMGKSNILGKLNVPITGAIGTVLYESFISPKIPVNGIAKDVIELLIGGYASKKKGIIGSTGKALVTLNSYQLMSTVLAPMLSKGVGHSDSFVYG